jgi:2-octaprenyl-6-methoxyphenol hydroxylase
MQYDIIIIGGGMVGASLACALQNMPLRIALIDAAPHAAINDARLIALTHGSCCLLKNLDLWPALAPYAEAIKQIHVSHRGHFGITRIHAAELDLKELGHLVPALHINTILDEKLKNISHIDVIRPATLKDILFEKDGADELAILTIQSGNETSTLKARMVIGADGTHSTVRQLLNISTKTIDYQQSAIVTITELHRDHHNIAYERFLSQGAIAMLPLTEQRCATIWTADNNEISQLLQLNDEDFAAKLQKEFGYRLGRFKRTLQRHHYPLKLVLAEESKKHNAILIGNAAHTLHPIAAQGFNLALYEVAELVEHIKQEVKDLTPLLTSSHGLSAGYGGRALDPADKPRDDVSDNLQHIINNFNSNVKTQLSHHLTQLFSSNTPVINIARQLGMLGLDFCKPAKKLFMQHSMGQAGKIPRLLREKDYYENHHSGH